MNGILTMYFLADACSFVGCNDAASHFLCIETGEEPRRGEVQGLSSCAAHVDHSRALLTEIGAARGVFVGASATIGLCSVELPHGRCSARAAVAVSAAFLEVAECQLLLFCEAHSQMMEAESFRYFVLNFAADKLRQRAGCWPFEAAANVLPGWGCCQCRGYNDRGRSRCRNCRHRRCDS